MKTCKMCDTEIKETRTYCSNKCKFSDNAYNENRKKTTVNDDTKLLSCIHCDFQTSDILNLGGHAKKHLLLHDIITDDYSIHYKMIDKPNVEMWSCPLCDWKSKDIKNVSGWITNHIIKNHSLSINEFVHRYEKYKHVFSKQMGIYNKQQSLLISDNRIVCKICNQSFSKLSQTHLSKHGTTPTEYKSKFGVDTTCSKATSILQSSKSNDPVVKSTMVKQLIKTNNERFGHNSYTQSDFGKQLIRKKTLINTYTKYKNSPILLQHVDLLFDIDEYNGNINNTYKFLCKKCNTKFDGKLENGRIPRCFSCYPKLKGFSNSELEVAEFLKTECNVDIIQNQKIDGVEIDIQIPSKNICVEYDGLYWHSELSGNKDNKYHINKTNICNNHGLRLIHIFEDEWIFRKDVVKSKLKNLVGISDTTIFARKCKIKHVPSTDKRDFLDTYHLQSNDKNSKHSFGLYFNDELISIMTFSKYKYIKNLNSVYELSRFAVKNNISLVGGFSKLLQHFIRLGVAKKIITFADKRWSTKNNVYIKNGFKYEYDTTCSYWYIGPSHNRIHRFNFRKKKLTKMDKYDVNLSEWEIMQLNGYDRIWDCGSIKYSLIV